MRGSRFDLHQQGVSTGGSPKVEGSIKILVTESRRRVKCSEEGKCGRGRPHRENGGVDKKRKGGGSNLDEGARRRHGVNDRTRKSLLLEDAA